MKYVAVTQGSSFPYPNHNVDPKDKGSSWCMQYARAAYYDFNFIYPKGIFSSNGGDYQRNRLYSLGKQPITQYRKLLGVDAKTGNTWLSIDWSIRSLISGYRDKVISRLMKEDTAIVATPIDAQAKTELDEMYNQIKAKLLVRQAMLQQNPELASHPLISLQSGEPLDLEELEMRVQMGEQFNRSKDAELAVALGLYENNYVQFRKMIYEDLFDCGVAGYEEWLGDDNKAKFKRLDPERVIISYCKDGTFSDMVHAGYLEDVSLVELATLTDDEGNALFTDAELQEFAGSIAGKFGNPQQIGTMNSGLMRPIDKFKCKVLDIKFYTYNESSYRSAQDEAGNKDFRKMDFNRGKKSEKYSRKRVQYVYKCKWIIGTDKCYDYGMCYDQKRSGDLKKKAVTELPFKFISTNFYEMQCQPLCEKLIPYQDDYQLTTLKIQNFKNRAVPSGWWIDLDALENIALNKGGKGMQPKELLQMFFDSGVLMGRSTGADGAERPANWKPVIPIENTAASELAMFYQDIVNTITTIEKMIGYNDITSGNPNPDTLVPGYQLADQNTNDALYPLAFAETILSQKLAGDVLCRMKQGIRKGEVTGYAPYKGALGVNTLRFISLDKGIANRDYGIELQKKSTEQEKAWIMQQINQDIANQLLDVSDAIMIIETHSAKQAMQVLAYKVKKAKQQVQQNQMAQQQQAIQGNQQSAAVAAQSAQQVAQMNFQLEIAKAKIAAQAEIQKAMIQSQSQERIANQTNYAKLSVGETTAQAKIASTALSGQSDIQKAHISGLHQQEKEKITADNKAEVAK